MTIAPRSRRACLPHRLVVALVIFAASGTAAAEGISVRVLHETAPVRGAVVESESQRAVTDLRGEASLPLVAGTHELKVTRTGFVDVALPIEVQADGQAAIVVQLRDAPLEDEAVVVTATRSGTVVGDQPIRVEAVPEEEIEENLTIQPGNLSTLLA